MAAAAAVSVSLVVGSTVLDVGDLDRAVRFWTAALGYAVRDASLRFVVLCDPSLRGGPNVSLQLSDEPKTGVNRVHLDLYAVDQAAEVARLESLGARRVPWTYGADADYVVMSDPDENEFCVVEKPQV